MTERNGLVHTDEELCQDIGAELVKIQDQAENEAIFDFASKIFYDVTKKNVFNVSKNEIVIKKVWLLKCQKISDTTKKV